MCVNTSLSLVKLWATPFHNDSKVPRNQYLSSFPTKDDYIHIMEYRLLCLQHICLNYLYIKIIKVQEIIMLTVVLVSPYITEN